MCVCVCVFAVFLILSATDHHRPTFLSHSLPACLPEHFLPLWSTFKWLIRAFTGALFTPPVHLAAFKWALAVLSFAFSFPFFSFSYRIVGHLRDAGLLSAFVSPFDPDILPTVSQSFPLFPPLSLHPSCGDE